METLELITKMVIRFTQSILISISLSLLALLYIVFYTDIPTDLFNKIRVKEQYQKADVIVVLGAGDTINGWPDRFSMERTVKGILLYKKGMAKKILYSGGWSHDGYIPSAKAMAAIARDLGVKPIDILVEETSKDTHDNAVNSSQIMRTQNLKTAILVTSDSHMRRSLGVFNKLNIPVYPAPVEERLVNKNEDWKPKFHNFSILYQVLYESFAMMKYQQNGWI